MMREIEVLERLNTGRYSCRSFRSELVSREKIETILRVAQRTASWCNTQPWQVAIASGRAADRFRSVLLAATKCEEPNPDFPWPREYTGIHLERRRACGFGLYESLGIKKGDRESSARQAEENFRLYGAPHVAIVTSAEELSVYGAIDCGAYVSNFMLAAHSLQVATVAQAALASRSELVRRHFGIASNRRVVCGISFGYADDSHAANSFRTSRADLQDVVKWFDD